jgi:hypothetical protein
VRPGVGGGLGGVGQRPDGESVRDRRKRRQRVELALEVDVADVHVAHKAVRRGERLPVLVVVAELHRVRQPVPAFGVALAEAPAQAKVSRSTVTASGPGRT